MTGSRGGTGFFRRWHLSKVQRELKEKMAHGPRGCPFSSFGLRWGTCVLLSRAEQEASILDLKAVLVGPRVQSGGWALRRPGRQSGDLGRK